MITGDVFKGDVSPVHLQAVGYFGLVLGDTHVAEVRCQYGADRVTDPIVNHLPHDFFNPRSPVTHTQIYPVACWIQPADDGFSLAATDFQQR